MNNSSTRIALTILSALLLSFCINPAIADSDDLRLKSSPFSIQVTGDNFSAPCTQYELFDFKTKITSITHAFKDSRGKKYKVTFDSNPLPSNRSYPSNLDITLLDSEDNKLGYLFFANNGIESLNDIGVFGFRVNDGGEMLDIRLIFDEKKSGALQLADLTDERFVQDTLMPSKNFQMIRPVLLKPVGKQLSKGFSLDSHPFLVNFTAHQVNDGVVEFQHNLYANSENNDELLISTYYHADSMETLRLGMFASKFFDSEYGAIKLVYYPTQGQTEP